MSVHLTDRRLIVEQRLLDLESRLERARNELAVAEEKVLLTDTMAEEARARMAAAETPLAHGEWCEARRLHCRELENAASARSRVREHEALRDELFDKLLG